MGAPLADRDEAREVVVVLPVGRWAREAVKLAAIGAAWVVVLVAIFAAVT